MAEESLNQIVTSQSADARSDPSRVAGADEVRSVSNVSVDRRLRLALELAALAVEHGNESGHDALALGRQLRAVADACTDATTRSHGLIGRPGA